MLAIANSASLIAILASLFSGAVARRFPDDLSPAVVVLIVSGAVVFTLEAAGAIAYLYFPIAAAVMGSHGMSYVLAGCAALEFLVFLRLLARPSDGGFTTRA